jgi:hypothetical protein
LFFCLFAARCQSELRFETKEAKIARSLISHLQFDDAKKLSVNSFAVVSRQQPKISLEDENPVSREPKLERETIFYETNWNKGDFEAFYVDLLCSKSGGCERGVFFESE